jgi:hypothetical protein
LLRRNLIPKSDAEAAFYRTDFGKSVAPYLSSAESLGKIGAAVGIGLSGRGRIGLRR